MYHKLYRTEPLTFCEKSKNAADTEATEVAPQQMIVFSELVPIISTYVVLRALRELSFKLLLFFNPLDLQEYCNFKDCWSSLLFRLNSILE